MSPQEFTVLADKHTSAVYETCFTILQDDAVATIIMAETFRTAEFCLPVLFDEQALLKYLMETAQINCELHNKAKFYDNRKLPNC